VFNTPLLIFWSKNVIFIGKIVLQMNSHEEEGGTKGF